MTKSKEKTGVITIGYPRPKEFFMGGPLKIPEKEEIWRPIETAPRDGTQILICNGNEIQMATYDLDKYAAYPKPYYRFGIRIMQCRDFKPTHWMPLPKPPVNNNTGE